MRKHILPLLLCLIMVMALMPTTALAAEASVTYLDESGVAKTVTATEVTSGTNTLNGGWYVVATDTGIAGSVNVSGAVNLILANGKTLTVNGGITDNNSNISTLSIYAQTTTDARGTLSVKNDSGNGINFQANGSKLNIYGGNVHATGTSAAMYIDSQINIRSANVTASANSQGIHSINGGVSISNSKVTASISNDDHFFMQAYMPVAETLLYPKAPMLSPRRPGLI